MKTKLNIIIPLTALLLSACTITAQVPPANSVELRQRNAAGDDWLYRLVSPAPNSLLTFGDDSTPAIAALGSGLTLASGTLTAAGVPPGGTTGQLLKKNSNADGDVKWELFPLMGNGVNMSNPGSGVFYLNVANFPALDYASGRFRISAQLKSYASFYNDGIVEIASSSTQAIKLMSGLPIGVRDSTGNSSQRIKIADPAEADDAATKLYVDDAIANVPSGFPITGDGASVENPEPGKLMLAANSVYFGGTNGAEFVLNNPDYSLFYNLPRPFYFRDQSNSPYFSEIEVNALGLTGRGHFWLLSNNAISVGNTAQQPQRITNLATPTGGSDAATKAYVDGKATGGSAGFPVTGTSASITNTNDGIININATNLIKIAANSNNNLGISNNGSYFVNLLGGQLVLYSDASPSGLYTKSNANIVSGNEAAVSLGHSASNATTNIIGRAVYANATALMQLQAPDFDLGSDSPIKVMNASWNALQRIKIADPTEADDGVTLGYAKSNFSRYQDAVSLTNPTQAEIDALGRCLRGQLEIILTDPDNNTLYINGFYWHAAVTQAPAIVIRIRSSRNNGIYCLGNKCITFCYSQAEGPVTIPYFIWSGDSLTFADTAAYPNSMVTITGNCNCSVGSVQTTGDHWAFATLRISLNGMLTLSSNVNIATLIPTGKLAIGEAFTGTIGTVTIGSYNAPLIIDNRPSHELDTFSRTGGGGFPINGDGVSLTNPSAGRFLLNVSNSTATKAAIEIDTGQNTKRLVLRSTDLATSANSYISLTESLVNIYGNNTLQLIGENLVFFQSSSDYAGLAISSGKVTLSAPDTSPRININNTVTSVFGKQTIIGTTTADQPVVVGRMENDGSYLGYQRISAADPVGANDLVTKQYADANYGGGFPFVGSGVRIMNTQEAVVSIERRIGGVFLPVFHSEAGYTSLSEPASDAYLNLGADVELGGSYLDLLGRGSVTIRSSGSVSLNAYQKARFEATESQTLISGVEVDQFRPSATIRLDNEGINIAGVDPVVGIKAPVIKMGPLGLSLVSPNQNNYSVDYSHLTFYRSSASLAYNGIGSTGRKGFYVQADLAYIMSDVAIAMQSDGNTASRQRVKAADPIDVDDLVTKSYADAHYISTGTDANGYSITIDAQGIHLKAPQNQSVLISGSGIYLNGTVYINDVQQ